MNKEKEIANLWFELIKTQAILDQHINGDTVDVEKAELIAWKIVSDKFPGQFKWKDGMNE